MSAPSPTRLKRWPLAVALVIAALLAVAALYVRMQLAPAGSSSVTQTFEIEPGWGAARIARELEAAGLIRDARVFGLYLRYRGLERRLGEGLYDLAPNLSAREVADTLAKGGRPRTVFVVIPEGFRLQDIARRLAEQGFGEAEGWLKLMRAPGELRPAVPADATLEGYLFPAGYELPVRSAPEEVLGMMLAHFQDEAAEHAEARQAAGLSVHAWVTLASMVQAEAANAEEMPVIAGVFLNRLELGMPLQSDPTVAYGLGKDLPELSVAAGDFETDHPWNTYTRAGLPAGPINNPGEAALTAVLEPTRTDEAGRPYLYFLHGSDEGQPVFRPNLTLEDHERDIARYLR